MQDPVVCSDGHSYERSAIEAWLKDHDTSYVTGDLLASTLVVPNRVLRHTLESLGMYAERYELNRRDQRL